MWVACNLNKIKKKLDPDKQCHLKIRFQQSLFDFFNISKVLLKLQINYTCLILYVFLIRDKKLTFEL